MHEFGAKISVLKTIGNKIETPNPRGEKERERDKKKEKN